MPSPDPLIERLRKPEPWKHSWKDTMMEAADALEAALAEIKELRRETGALRLECECDD